MILGNILKYNLTEIYLCTCVHQTYTKPRETSLYTSTLDTLTTSSNKSIIQTDSVKSNQHILSIQDIVGNNNSYINFKNECFWANLGKISSPKYISAHI